MCPRCEGELKRTTQSATCFYCKKRSLFGLTHPACKRKNGVDGCVYSYTYNILFRKIIHKVKYGGAHRVLKELLSTSFADIYKILRWWNKQTPLLTQSIPLSEKRRRERGFNQCDIIARSLCFYLGIKQAWVLKKVKETKNQAMMHTDIERKENLKGAFALGEKTITTNILLVDDVVTSGSTIKECVQVLKKGGATNVFVFSLAHG